MNDESLSIEKGYFNLMCVVVKECFHPIKRENYSLDYAYERRKEEVQARRIKFANSKLVEIWADCSNFEYEKIKKDIIKFNS